MPTLKKTAGGEAGSVAHTRSVQDRRPTGDGEVDGSTLNDGLDICCFWRAMPCCVDWILTTKIRATDGGMYVFKACAELAESENNA
jgi:hypothetical protein